MGTRQRFTKEFKLEAVRLMKHSGQPTASAQRRDRERRHDPVGHVREEGEDHDARPAIQSEQSHAAHRHEDEVQRRARARKYMKPTAL